VRRLFGSKSNARLIAPSANATTENDITKPAARDHRRSGLAGLADRCPEQDRQHRQRTGRGHGDDTREQRKNEMTIGTSVAVPAGPCVHSDRLMFFAMLMSGVTRAALRQPHVCVRISRADLTKGGPGLLFDAFSLREPVSVASSAGQPFARKRSKRRTTRLGGIPAGSLEVLGR